MLQIPIRTTHCLFCRVSPAELGSFASFAQLPPRLDLQLASEKCVPNCETVGLQDKPLHSSSCIILHQGLPSFGSRILESMHACTCVLAHSAWLQVGSLHSVTSATLWSKGIFSRQLQVALEHRQVWCTSEDKQNSTSNSVVASNSVCVQHTRGCIDCCSHSVLHKLHSQHHGCQMTSKWSNRLG